MDERLNNAANALEAFVAQMQGQVPHEQPIMDIGWSWNSPPISMREMMERPLLIARKIREVEQKDLTPDLVRILDLLPSRVQKLQSQGGNFPSGNIVWLYPMLDPMLDWVEDALPRGPVDWEVLAENGTLPKQLTQRLRGLDAKLNTLEPKFDTLAAKIATINDAEAAADRLPVDLESLREDRAEVQRIVEEAKTLAADLGTKLGEVDQFLALMGAKSEEPYKLIQNCAEAYRATTTQGLAGAFELKAKALSQSYIAWVVLLVVGLGLGVWAGLERIYILQGLIEQKVGTNVLWANALLSLVTVAAPVWFAWLATKQIGQRFRLSEDYAFKAVFSKAYEGYRREAAGLDQALSARLFASALNRLDESPLRLVETQTHGSPMHELLSLPGMSKAMEAIPELREGLLGFFARAGQVAKKE